MNDADIAWMLVSTALAQKIDRIRTGEQEQDAATPGSTPGITYPFFACV